MSWGRRAARKNGARLRVEPVDVGCLDHIFLSDVCWTMSRNSQSSNCQRRIFAIISTHITSYRSLSLSKYHELLPCNPLRHDCGFGCSVCSPADGLPIPRGGSFHGDGTNVHYGMCCYVSVSIIEGRNNHFLLCDALYIFSHASSLLTLHSPR